MRNHIVCQVMGREITVLPCIALQVSTQTVLNSDLPVKVERHFVFFSSVTLKNLLIFVYSFQICRLKFVTFCISMSCFMHNVFPDLIFGAAATLSQSYLRFIFPCYKGTGEVAVGK